MSKAARDLDRLATVLRYPKTWLVCPHCGAHSWRFPPHGPGEACPLVVSAAEAANLKFDAERMAALRMGNQMEEATRFMKQHFGMEDEEVDDEE